MRLKVAEPKIVVLKAILTVFIFYHLLAVLILPVGSSMFGRKIARYLTPYANTLGFNTTWQFFSPGPSPVFYLEYDVEMPPLEEERDRESSNESEAQTADDAEASPSRAEDLVQTQSYPPPRQGLSLSDSWNRRLFSMRYLALNGDFLERFLGPYLCRSVQAGAQAVVVRRVVERVEDVEKPGEWIDFRDMLQRYDFPPVRVSCLDAKGTEEQQ